VITYGRGPAGTVYDQYPCGGCAAYVLVVTGCEHWAPLSTSTNPRQSRNERHKFKRKQDALKLAEFRRLQRLGI
jgi:hypothetical protein